MGSDELLAALRREGESKTRAIREEAEAASARLRGEAVARLALLREEYARQQGRAIEAELRAAAAQAERAARCLRLAGDQRLAARLFNLALTLLPRLRDGECGALFARLSGELPPCQWETVRVNPADLEPAGLLFASARIVPDCAISGGLEALAKGGDLRVVNTLEKRLERGWAELLPLLFKELADGA